MNSKVFSEDGLASERGLPCQEYEGEYGERRQQDEEGRRVEEQQVHEDLAQLKKKRRSSMVHVK